MRRNNTGHKVLIAVLILAPILIAISLYLTFRTRKVAYQVKAAVWIATTNVREKTLRHNGDWGRPYESSAFNVECHRKFYGTEDCNCVSVGDDMLSEICSRCDVYKQWCEYDYYAWPVIRTKSNTGKPDSKPVHPILSYDPPNQRAEMSTKFPVNFANEEKETKHYNARGLQELRKYDTGDWWEVDVNHAGKFIPVKEFHGERQ